MNFIDQNSETCFIDQNSETEFVDQNGDVLSCGDESGIVLMPQACM